MYNTRTINQGSYSFFIHMFFRVQICMSGSRLTNLLAIFYQKSSTDTKRTVLSALIVSNKTTYLLEDKSQLAAMESGNRQTRAWSPYCHRH